MSNSLIKTIVLIYIHTCADVKSLNESREGCLNAGNIFVCCLKFISFEFNQIKIFFNSRDSAKIQSFGAFANISALFEKKKEL